jgi:hypothetical protein
MVVEGVVLFTHENFCWLRAPFIPREPQGTNVPGSRVQFRNRRSGLTLGLSRYPRVISFIHLPPEDLMACICSVLYGTPHTALLSFLVRCCMDKWVSVCAPMSDGGRLDIFPVLGGRSPCHQPVQPAFTLHTCVVAYNSVAVCSLSAASNAWAM